MRILGFMMVATAAFSQGAAAEPVPATPACKPALQALLDRWHAMHFAVPAKPAQYRVYGAAGRSLSGHDFYFAVAEIREAADNCDIGDDAASLHRIKAAETELGYAANGEQ